MRGIPDKILFTGPDIYDFVADQQKKLKKAYEALPDEQALDENFVVAFKQKFMLDVPRLKPEEWTSEQKANQPAFCRGLGVHPFRWRPCRIHYPSFSDERNGGARRDCRS